MTKVILQERLQIDCLIGLDLADMKTYGLETKQKTALYFRQKKFNLMKEESEGYSKLITAFAKYASTNNAEYEDIFRRTGLTLILLIQLLEMTPSETGCTKDQRARSGPTFLSKIGCPSTSSGSGRPFSEPRP